MATVTTYATATSLEGHKILFAGVQGNSAYAVGGDPVSAGQTGVAVNAIIMCYGNPANGIVAQWDNGAGKFKYMTATNSANCTALIECNGATNLANVTFPVIIVGTATH